jgi:uncharacterized protein (TIGR02996 family)
MPPSPNLANTALLRAALDSLEDNLPRLVLADWLEANGLESRAVEIRSGVAAVLVEELSG